MEHTETIEELFEKFDRENPHVYAQLLELTRQAQDRGSKKIGIKMLFEVVRWNRILATRGDDFKLNNNYHSRYARKILMEYPELATIFETRSLRA